MANHNTGHSQRRRGRTLRLENLESRVAPALTVTGTTPAAIFDGTAYQAVNSKQLKVAFSDPTPGGADLVANYNLIDLGADGLPGTPDDIPVDISSVAYKTGDPAGTYTLSLFVPLSVSPNGYQLTVDDGITDSSSQPLDGDADGTPGGDFIRQFTVVPKSFTMTGFSAGATAGVPGTFTVTAIDADGSIAAGYRGTVSFTSTDAQAVLPGDYTFTASDAGAATFGATLNTAGNQTIVATSTAFSALSKSLTVNVQPGAVAGFNIEPSVTSSVAGTPISVVVTAVDAFGNRVPDYTGTVQFSSSDPQAAIPSAYTFTLGDAGDRTFSFTPKTAGPQTLTATDGSATGTSAAVQVSAAVVKKLEVSTTTTTVMAGTSADFLIKAVDAYGNQTADYLGTVTFTSTDTRAELPPDYTFTAADAGAHTISVLFKSAGLRTVAATDVADTTIAGKAQNIEVVAAAAAYFTVDLPDTTPAGTPFDVTVEVKDEFANRATGYRGTVQFDSSDSSATVPANYTFTETDAGVHTFTGQTVLNLVGIYNIQVADTANAAVFGKGSTQVTAVPAIYVEATNTIYISAQTVTLSDIKAQLPDAPLNLIDASNSIWKLDARLMLMDGATLKLHGTSIGGDVNELRLRSDTYLLSDGSENPENTVWIKAIYGNIHIDSTKITSWDDRISGPDTNPGVVPPRSGDDGDDNAGVDHQRAFLSVRSYFADDGVTPLESRMDILNSEIAYLGSHATEGYGLSWKALGVGAEVHSRLRVYGDVKNSNIHHNFFGIYMYGAYGSVIDNNEVAYSVWYGIDPHDDSNNLVITNNWAHHNGTHGIIISKRCHDALIANNIVEHNGEHGIMIHRGSNNAVIENNTVRHNGDVGIAFYESFGAKVRNNVVTHNSKGIRFSMGAGQNDIGDPLNEASGNEIAFNTFAGIDFLTGNDEPDTGPADRRPFENVITGNYIHDNGKYAIRVTHADRNTFLNNRIENESLIRFANARDNVFDGNAIPTGLLIALSGSAEDSTNVRFLNQPDGLYKVDDFSTAIFGDVAGVILDTGDPSLPTTVLPAGSVLELTSANAGAGEVRVQALSMWVDVPVDGTQVVVTPIDIPADPSLPRSWIAQSDSATKQVTYVLAGLTPGELYDLHRDGETIQSALADAEGRVTLMTTPGSTSSHTYQVVVSTGSDDGSAGPENISYNSSTKTITVSGAVYITPTLLQALAPAGSIDLVDAANQIWHLKVNIVLADGASFRLKGTAAGGDVNELRLRSNNTSGGGSVVSIEANWGQIVIDSVRVTSWDDAVGGPDTQHSTNGRAGITAISFIEDGVAHQSTLSIHNSEVSYLGSHLSNPGLLWTLASTSETVLSGARVLGSITNSLLHDNYIGAFAIGAASTFEIRDSEIHNNISDGLRIYYSPDVALVSNDIHDNAGTGVVVSFGSTGVSILENTIESNGQIGLSIDLASSGVTVDGNQIIDNDQVGVSVTASDGSIIRNNRIADNREGLRLDLLAGMTKVTGNEIASNTSVGVMVRNGSGSGDPSRANIFIGNNIHDNGQTAIQIRRAHNNQFTSNTVNGSREQTVQVHQSTGTTFTANEFGSTVIAQLRGKRNSRTVATFVDQAATRVQVDEYSTAIFISTSGATFKVGSKSVPTTVSPTTSTITLTRSLIGGPPILVTTQALQVVTDFGNAEIDSSGWSSPRGTKSFDVTAGSSSQSLTYRLGDLTPGASYVLKKGSTTIGTLTPDAFGWAEFTDIAGTTEEVTYSITPA